MAFIEIMDFIEIMVSMVAIMAMENDSDRLGRVAPHSSVCVYRKKCDCNAFLEMRLQCFFLDEKGRLQCSWSDCAIPAGDGPHLDAPDHPAEIAPECRRSDDPSPGAVVTLRKPCERSCGTPGGNAWRIRPKTAAENRLMRRPGNLAGIRR
jgi:hypothetical protein